MHDNVNSGFQIYDLFRYFFLFQYILLYIDYDRYNQFTLIMTSSYNLIIGFLVTKTI